MLLWLQLLSPLALAQQRVHLYLDWQHQFEFAGYYAAKAQGYYAEAGLDVQIHPLDQQHPVIPQVLTGVGAYGVQDSRLILAYLQGKPVVMLANLLKHSPHKLLTQIDISNPAQLRQRRIMSTTNELQEASFLSMLRQSQLSGYDYHLVPHQFSPQPFSQGQIDAMTARGGILSSQLDQEGISYNTLTPGNYAGLLYAGNLFTSATELVEHPDRVARFLHASLRGWEYALQHEKEIITLIQHQYRPDLRSQILQQEAQQVETAILPALYPLGSISQGRLEQISAIYRNSSLPLTRHTIGADFIYLAEQTSPPAGLVLSAEEQRFLAKFPVLQVHNEQNWPPINFNEAGQPMGYSIDYMNLLAERLGVKVAYQTDGQWSDYMRRLQRGELDIMLNITKTADRQKDFLFTPPYLQASSGIYVRTGSVNESVRSLKDLAGKRVAVPRGFFLQEMLARFYPEVIIVPYPDSVASLEAVSAGDADAIIGRTGVISYLIRQYFIPNLSLVSVVDDTRFTSDMRLAVRKDRPLLRDILTKAMNTLSEEEIAALRQRWGQSSPTSNGELTRHEREYLQHKGVIHLCVDPDWMPLDALDNRGQHIGMAADYFALIKDYLQAPMDILPTDSWEDSLQAAREHRCDVVSLLSPTPARRQFLNFTTPLLKTPFVVATRKEALFVENFEQLAGKSIGVVHSYSTRELLQQRYPNARFVEVDSLLDGLMQVESGKLYAMIDSAATIGYLIREQGLLDVAITGRLDIPRELHVGVRNDEPMLLGIMQKAVNHISADQHQRLRSRWATVEFVESVNYTLLLWVLLVSAALLSFFIYRHYVLQRYNQEIERAHRELMAKNHELEILSTTDSLTGVYNRVKINSLLASELERVKRYSGQFSLIMMDLDHFKQVNDNLGHPVGDKVLIRTTEVVRHSLRSTDTLGRWGGEEFIIICPEIGLQGALHCAENLRKTIARTDFSPVSHQYASFGVVAYQPDDSAESLLYRVDAALYLAKKRGRNQVAYLPEKHPPSPLPSTPPESSG